MASRRRRVGVCELGGELLELGRGRVGLVAALERVEPAFAERLVELDEHGGEVRGEPGGLGEDREQLFVGQLDILEVGLTDRRADRRRGLGVGEVARAEQLADHGAAPVSLVQRPGGDRGDDGPTVPGSIAPIIAARDAALSV